MVYYNFVRSSFSVLNRLRMFDKMQIVNLNFDLGECLSYYH